MSKNKIIILLVLFIVFIASILLQYIVLVPGSSLYENYALFVTLSVITYVYQIFLIMWLIDNCRFYVGLIFAVGCLVNIYLNINYTNISKHEIIYKDAYVSIGYVTNYESLKTCNRVSYKFYDKSGCLHDVAERFSGTCESDTILVVFNGALPHYFKHYNLNPSRDEINLYLSGPQKLR